MAQGMGGAEEYCLARLDEVMKDLWYLKWHRQFDTGNATTLTGYVWPDWMRDMADK